MRNHLNTVNLVCKTSKVSAVSRLLEKSLAGRLMVPVFGETGTGVSFGVPLRTALYSLLREIAQKRWDFPCRDISQYI